MIDILKSLVNFYLQVSNFFITAVEDGTPPPMNPPKPPNGITVIAGVFALAMITIGIWKYVRAKKNQKKVDKQLILVTT